MFHCVETYHTEIYGRDIQNDVCRHILILLLRAGSIYIYERWYGKSKVFFETNRKTHRVQNVNDAVQKNLKTKEKIMKKTPKNDVLKK